MTDASRLQLPPSRERQTFSGASRFIAYANLVKLPHTIFALPFALVGVVLASYRRPLRLSDLGWVIAAFTAARFAAMAFNRIVDREIDRRNPRTAMRELPRGALGVGETWIAVVVASACSCTPRVSSTRCVSRSLPSRSRGFSSTATPNASRGGPIWSSAARSRSRPWAVI